MPLFELFQMAKAKFESSLEKPTSSSDDLSSVPENELAELTWENGQVVLQGQSSRAKRSPFSNNSPSSGSKSKEAALGDDTRPKSGRFRNLECGLSEFPVNEPSSEIGLGQEDDMVPWLSFPASGSLQNDYCCDFLPELTGVSVNEVKEASPGNDFGMIDKSSSQIYRESHGIDNGVHSLGQTEASKFSSSAAGETAINSSSQLYALPYQQFLSPLPCFRSRALDNASTSTSSCMSQTVCRDKARLPTSVVVCSTVKVQSQDLENSDRSSGFTNFSCLSRPASLYKVNNAKSGGQTAGFSLLNADKSAGKEKASSIVSSTPRGSIFAVSSDGVQQNRRIDYSKTLDGKQYGQQFPAGHSEAICLESTSKNAKLSCQNYQASVVKGSTEVEKTTEHVDGSSVCSGNSLEKVLDDPKNNLKRKCHETYESDSPSEDVEEDPTHQKKQNPARGASKRSRAAEVHNLSERRRRDRINEKMRALQELIPNCNKVDKASMLDEAIEYLKTLQLQVQMMSIGAGLYLPPMMVPTGMHPAQMPHFQTFSVGMGSTIGFGMGTVDMNGCSSDRPVVQVPPLQGLHFPGPLMSARMAGANLHMFGFPGQGIPLPMPRTPLVPFPGRSLMKPAVGLSACGIPTSMGNPDSAVASRSKEAPRNLYKEALQNTNSICLRNQSSSQQSARAQSSCQTSDVSGRMAIESTGNDGGFQQTSCGS